MINRILIIQLLVVVFIVSCKDEIDTPVIFVPEDFPLKQWSQNEPGYHSFSVEYFKSDSLLAFSSNTHSENTTLWRNTYNGFSLNVDTEEIQQLTGAELGGFESIVDVSPDETKFLCHVRSPDILQNISLRVIETGEVIEVTKNDAENRAIGFNSNGSKVLYHSNVDGSFDVFVYDITSGLHTKISQTQNDEFAVAWHPNNDIILLRAVILGKHTPLLSTNFGAPLDLFRAENKYFVPADINSNGQIVGFTDYFNGQHLAIIEMDGSNITQISPKDELAGGAQFSPNGALVVYLSTSNAGTPTIRIVDIRGKDPINHKIMEYDVDFYIYFGSFTSDGLEFSYSMGNQSRFTNMFSVDLSVLPNPL